MDDRVDLPAASIAAEDFSLGCPDDKKKSCRDGIQNKLSNVTNS